MNQNFCRMSSETIIFVPILGKHAINFFQVKTFFLDLILTLINETSSRTLKRECCKKYLNERDAIYQGWPDFFSRGPNL